MRITASQLRRLIREEVSRLGGGGTFSDLVAAVGLSASELRAADPRIARHMNTSLSKVDVGPSGFAGVEEYTISFDGKYTFDVPADMGRKLEAALAKMAPTGSPSGSGNCFISGPEVEIHAGRQSTTLSWPEDCGELASHLRAVAGQVAKMRGELDFSAANGLTLIADGGDDIRISWSGSPAKLSRDLDRVAVWVEAHSDEMIQGDCD